MTSFESNGYDYRYIRFKCGHETNMFCDLKFVEDCKKYLCPNCDKKRKILCH